MKLPNLSDLDLDDDLSEFIEEPEKEVKRKPKRAKVAKPKKATKEKSNKDEEPGLKDSGKPKIPKTKYDSEGNPILSIPDLDDIDLTKELDRFFD